MKKILGVNFTDIAFCFAVSIITASILVCCVLTALNYAEDHKRSEPTYSKITSYDILGEEIFKVEGNYKAKVKDGAIVLTDENNNTQLIYGVGGVRCE